MPLVTYSRKSSDLSNVCRMLAQLASDSKFERRGTKTIKRMTEIAEKKGFSCVVIAENLKKGSTATLLRQGLYGWYWSTTYIIKKKGKGIAILDKDGNDAKEEFKQEAE